MKAWAKSIEVLWKETRWNDMERRREEERKIVKNDVRCVGFAVLKACGGLRDQVCIHQADRVAREILDWSQRARAQHEKKKEIVPEKPDNPLMTQRVRACLVARARTGPSQPSRKKLQGSMQRLGRIKHRCSTTMKSLRMNKIHYVMVEKEHMKCRMCAQTRPFDKVTIFLTQQCPAADQTNWMVRIQQPKNEMDVEQQGRVGDIRNLLGLQVNTPRPKEKHQDATTRRPIKGGSESGGPNLRMTKRETDAAQKRQESLKLRAKMHIKGLSRDRDVHWIAVEEEVSVTYINDSPSVAIKINRNDQIVT